MGRRMFRDGKKCREKVQITGKDGIRRRVPHLSEINLEICLEDLYSQYHSQVAFRMELNHIKIGWVGDIDPEDRLITFYTAIHILSDTTSRQMPRKSQEEIKKAAALALARRTFDQDELCSDANFEKRRGVSTILGHWKNDRGWDTKFQDIWNLVMIHQVMSA